jgi:flagellar biosynthetic protein FlhB
VPPDSDKQSKTERASSYKLKRSREQGQVAKSQDLSTTVTFIVTLVMIAIYSPKICSEINLVFRQIFFDYDLNNFNELTFQRVITFLFKELAITVIPISAVAWLIAFVISAAQVGLHFSTKPLEPNFDKINPIKGFERLFSLRGVISTTLSVIKMVIIAAVACSVVFNPNNSMVLMHLGDLNIVIKKSADIIWELAMKTSFTLLAISIIDYSYQKWQFLEDQKMSKHEVKEEHKEQEGNPTIKSKIRSIQRETARKRGLKEVIKDADVIVTNPFHIAVAIKYDRQFGTTAPLVVAKGARLLALRIREFAKEANVDIVVNIPLARSLYKQCKVGYEITPELYVAVAEVLAFVFRKRDKKRKRFGL